MQKKYFFVYFCAFMLGFLSTVWLSVLAGCPFSSIGYVQVQPQLINQIVLRIQMVSSLPSAVKTFLFLPGKSLDFIRVLTPFFSAERCTSGAAFAFVGPFQEQTQQFKESIY